jgi:phosphoglycerate dehydrogenase-like enzyme
MGRTGSKAICVAPDSSGWIADAVRDAGVTIVDASQASAVVWTDARDAEGLASLLAAHAHIEWVQVPFAGIENFVSIIDDSRMWTCGKGVYAEPVGEHVIGLALAGMRNIANYARADRWTGPKGFNLLGARVTLVGGGGITETLLRLLAPFDCRVTVVRKRVDHLDGAHEVVDIDHLVDALTGADLVVLALSLTPETEGIIGRSEFEVMEPHAWIVNVARGKHIITDDLVWALSGTRPRWRSHC